MGSPVKPREWEKTLTVKCRLCGGAKCKRCSESAALAKTNSPVLGLHADWVTDRILGMMRPSSRLMKDYQIAEQFHKLRISAVFNLTLPGEHPYCGDGLGASGFPYDPEKDLMSHSIRFYNFGWEDMTTPTLPFMMDIVKVMASVLQDGHQKVAVHCHAGYGRTGLAIACVLIFMHNIAPDQAIKIVRRDRPGSVQTAAQAKFVRTFHEYINASKVAFALPSIHDRFSVGEVLEHQNRTVHGAKTSGTTHHAVPRVLDFLCREVERAADAQPVAVVHAFVTHVPFAQLEGKSAGDAQSLHESHVRGIFGATAPPSSDSVDTSGATSTSDTTSTNGNGTSSTGRGSHFVNAPTAPVSAPPPVPSFLLSSTLTRHVSPDELFPIKVALNVGEANWREASALCASTGVACVPVLLLDWLEHLVEPLLDASVLDSVTAHDGETHAIKSKALNKLPIHVVKSLDRLVTCLRALQQTALTTNALATSTGVSAHDCSSSASAAMLFDAVCARTAMALFHIRSATSASLARHADFVAMLVRDWHAPKRLELNLESLQKLGKVSSPPSARKLSHITTTSNTSSTSSSSGSSSVKSALVLEQSLTSPKTPRSTGGGGGDHAIAVVLEPVILHPPRPASASASASSSPRDHVLKPKESYEGVVAASSPSPPSSPSAHTAAAGGGGGGGGAVPAIHSPRPAPSDHLPKATRGSSSSFETTSSSSSPVKIEPLHLHARAPSDRPPSPLKTSSPSASATSLAAAAPDGSLSPAPHHHHHHYHYHPSHHVLDAKKDSSDALLSTSPTRSMSLREKESEQMAPTGHASPTSGGLATSSSACVLPSVRGGDRYKHKHS